MSNNEKKIKIKHCTISEASLNSNEGKLNLKLTFNSDKNITEKGETFLNEFDDFLITEGYGEGVADKNDVS
ncbi:hypothetical protein IEQ_05035 [Bacillus cereus BAG6X1-2]|nr:hypothetical protein IEQ_05035 [Bacillus cereus BAG6X1-2]